MEPHKICLLLVTIQGICFARWLPDTNVSLTRQKRCSPDAQECCKYRRDSMEYRDCCERYQCCHLCNDFNKLGTYHLRDDCASAWECCRFEMGTTEFNNCCNDHGCCPLCRDWKKGCLHGSEKFGFGSIVETHPTMCVKLQCVANITSTPPYITAAVMPMYYNPGNLDYCVNITTSDCVDKYGIYRYDGAQWFVSALCQQCHCNSGSINCRPVKLKCPPAPHPNCLALGRGCCPIWDCEGKIGSCVTSEGTHVPYGETWWDSKDRCVYKKCTESGVIQYTHVNCSGSCPDPESFGRVCIQYFNQCMSHEDCKDGYHCCLVAGCGKECIRINTSPCVDENGVHRKIGETWYSSDPTIKQVCLSSGISAVEDVKEKVITHPVDPTVDPYPVDPKPLPPLPVDLSLAYPSPYDCLLKSGINLTVLADQLETLGHLNEEIPIRDSNFFVDAFASLSTEVNGTLNISISDRDLNKVQTQARAFDWAAVLPLLNVDTTQQKLSALNVGELNVRVSTTVARVIADKNITIDEHSPSDMHQVAFRRTDPISTKMSELGLAIGEATSQFLSSLNLPAKSASALTLLGEVSDCSRRFSGSLRPPLEPPCNPENKYRTLDGTCNNLDNNLWGAAFTKFRRILHPDYGDGVSTLRRAADEGPLPSARLVSTKVNTKPSEESSDLSFFHVTFGQFLDHDLTATPISKGYLGSAIKCCDDLRKKLVFAELSLNNTKAAIREAQSMEPSLTTISVGEELDITARILLNLKDEGERLIGTTLDAFEAFLNKRLPRQVGTSLPLQSVLIPQRPHSGECAPILIPHDDEFYSCFGETCMEFVRSVPAPMCTFGPRQQLNQHTAYLDGSVIYGVKKETTDILRKFEDGLLKTQVTMEDKVLLPAEEDRDDGCNVDEKYDGGIFCFKAGDGRVNEQILLTLFQTVWGREHNRVAKILKSLNDWDDEKLFQEARRIVVAELQHVTYKEYLPLVLGNVLMTFFNLNPLHDDHYTMDYDETLDASIANSFATAAYRFGHSQINDYILKVNRHGAINTKSLSSMFFNPFSLYDENTVEDLSRGGSSFPSRKVDGYFSDEVAGKLFKGSGHFGLDLVALNIQRGRDHGLPGYVHWKSLCGPSVSEFSDLLSVMDEDIVNALEDVYSSVEDIDLFIGGVSERPFFDGIIGPTFTCILLDQFARIKRGDRFWYEYKDSPGAFNEAQLKELHKVSLARIFCNNVPELTSIQPHPLKLPSLTNPKVSCYSPLIEDYSLSPWQM